MDRSRLFMIIILVAVIGAATFIAVDNPFQVKPTTPLKVAGSQYDGSWLTYHGNNSRSGYDQSEPSISSPALAWSSSQLDGDVYAEPLLMNRTLYIATENDSVYALNQTSGAVIWRTNLGEPVPLSSLPCGDIDPSGITGTAVIDPASHLIYVVAFLQPRNHTLFAINSSNGSIEFSRNVDPPGDSPTVLQQRAALALSNGYVYISYGGLLGDCGSYHGWVVAAPANNSGALLSYEVPTSREAGIWGPSGPAVDSSGDIYVATGNGESTTNYDYGDSVIKLSPTLHVLSYFAPSNWVQLNGGDTDLGSEGPALLPGDLVFQAGKEGVGFLLNASDLGGIGGEIFSAPVCDGAYGGTSFSDSVIYLPCTNGLFALQVSSDSFTTLWSGPRFFAGPPIIAGGAVWTIDTGNAVLYALSLQNGSVLLKYNLGNVEHFITPTSGNGYIFVGAGNVVRAFAISS